MEYTLDQVGEIAGRVLEKARSLRSLSPAGHATVITFSGDLGAGKTTLIQEMARQLGVSQDLQSPTFVIYKRYPVPEYLPSALDESGAALEKNPWQWLIHGDMYRLEDASDIEKLGWQDLVNDSKNIICIEWPEKITGAIPDFAMCVVIKHLGGEKRAIEI